MYWNSDESKRATQEENKRQERKRRLTERLCDHSESELFEIVWENGDDICHGQSLYYLAKEIAEHADESLVRRYGIC